MRSILSLIVLCLLLHSTPVFAAKRFALVWGNDAYETLPPLKKAVDDARAVGDALESVGFQVLRRQNVTQRQMQDSLLDLAGQVGNGDTVFVFFAGHGVAIDGGNYLLPIDTPVPQGTKAEARIKLAGLTESSLIQVLKETGAELTVVVLDACRDNPFAASGTRSIGQTRGLTRAPDERGVFGLYSAGFGQTALDNLGNGDDNPNSVFTRILAPALREPGLSLVDLAYTVNEKVEALALTIGHEQSPAYYDQAKGQRVFLAGLPQIDKPTSIPADPCKDAAAHWGEIKSLNEKSLYEDHIRLFGSCPFSGLAKSALQKLDGGPAWEAECDQLFPSAENVPKGARLNVAIDACARAAQTNPRRFTYRFGHLNVEFGHYNEAIDAFRRSVDAGYVNAIYDIAGTDDKFNKNDASALVSWFQREPRPEEATALAQVAGDYRIGINKKLDLVKSAKWFRKAAQAGDIGSMLHMASLYHDGKEVIQDDDEALAWYQKAADAGEAEAMFQLSIFHEKGFGTNPDPKIAVRWRERALRDSRMFTRRRFLEDEASWSPEFVRAFQTRLADLGIYKGPIDGVLNSQTREAVQSVVGKKS